jgi:beta-glucuronidase
VGKVAQDRLEALLRLHPELGVRLEGAKITIQNGFDNEVDNDVVVTDPGQLVRVLPEDVNPPSIDLSKVKAREVGKGKVRLRRYENGHWQLLVNGKPWVIHGILYQPTAVGESPDEGTLKDWMTADRNQNGKADGPFDVFVDANNNNQHDPDEPVVGDFELMRRAGVNTIRLYHQAPVEAKPLLRQLYEQYGIMVAMGDLVGMYTVGSGAKWEEGTDYHDPVQRKRMFESVKKMVREFKKEPYILMWVLGNENNYGGMHGIIGGVGNAAQYPEEYYKFLNDLAVWIHKEDPNHPVALANGEWLFVDLIAKVAPAIDVFGANVYRGTHGFGRSFFQAIHDQLDRPVFFTEFGCPSYQAGQPLETGETGQALYHLGNWVDLEDNMAGRGVGNALGGITFAWVDEWWKAGQPPKFSPWVQETTPNWSGPFPGGKNYEEWFGVTGQGDGSQSPYLRHLRQAFYFYERMWNTDAQQRTGLSQDK